MSFTLTAYRQTRPFLYHVLARRNLSTLRKTKRLLSAERLAGLACEPGVVECRRENRAKVQLPDGSVWLHDQRPLHQGPVRLEGGWGYRDLLRALNRRVFFWPGTVLGPIAYGKRHFQTYAESDVLLRCRFEEVQRCRPQFSRFNSGSPRCSRGRRSPRGPRTFLTATECDFTPGRVVEVVFMNELELPGSLEWRPGLEAAWRRVF